MMNWRRLAGKAKQVVDKRGGKESVVEDAKESGDIAGGEGTLADTGKQAAAAVKQPGAPPDGAPSAANQNGAAAG